MSDRIEKHVVLKAPVSRVWRAVTDSSEFGEWFGVKLDGPFVQGQVSRGNITYPGYEHVIYEALIREIQPRRRFAFSWAHPESLDRESYSPDYSNEPTTLVEFVIERTEGGTLLSITESGFDQLPEDRREECYRRNEGGWTQQIKNIGSYLSRK
jgi:uncharacterized protein YndB with AHSA1/START domain